MDEGEKNGQEVKEAEYHEGFDLEKLHRPLGDLYESLELQRRGFSLEI